MKYNGQIISRGTKDPSTDLWVLLLTPKAISESQTQLWTSLGDDETSNHNTKPKSRAGPGMARAPQSPKPCTEIASVAMFTHSVRTRANTVKYGHQAICNPKISSLLKALRKGFLERVSQSIRRIGHKVFKSKSGDGQRAHEMSKERYTKHKQESQNKG